jgi:hypothetical protein
MRLLEFRAGSVPHRDVVHLVLEVLTAVAMSPYATAMEPLPSPKESPTASSPLFWQELICEVMKLEFG